MSKNTVSDSFNPYAEWLGLDASIASPNHYELLGIDKAETDPAAIASAADRAMTKVRACKPGANAAAWAALLDRITEAKTTLTDPAQRANYDQQRTQTPAAPSTVQPTSVDPNLLPPGQAAPTAPIAQPTHVDQASTPTPVQQVPDPMAPMAPAPVATPASATPVAPVAQPVPASPQAAVPQAVPYLQPAATDPAAPNPMAPVASPIPTAPATPQAAPVAPNPMAPVPQAVPVQPTQAPAAAPMPTAVPGQVPAAAPMPVNPMQPAAAPVASPIPATPNPPTTAPVAVPQAAPVASPMLAAQPAAPIPAAAATDQPQLARKPSATARARSSSGGVLGPILLGGGVGGVILVVVGVAYWLINSKPNSGTQLAGDPTPAPQPAPVEPTPSSTIPRRLDEMPEDERPQPTTFELPYDEPDPIDVRSTDMTPLVDSMTEPDTSSTMTTDPNMPESEMSAPEMSESEPMEDAGPTREELQALSRSMMAARAAIGDLDLTEADREIAAGLAIAKSDEHKAKLTRLQLLSNYIGRFQEAIDETLNRVDAGDQISIGDDKSFGIVEKSAELLVVRYNGRNLRYPRKELPPGLANRLAEMTLGKDLPETAAAKAAFVSVDPDVDDAALEKARTWWEEASTVADVQDLITAINDDYSLRSEMMDVPLDPNAMEALAARADRLQNATTIEEFANEYQSIIDESLKTLGPDTELTVGGSTTITIKEVKTDRVMLTIAGETRGFQLSKLPLGLAASIAERIIPRDVPLAMLMKGAYYANREKSASTKQFRAIVFEWWKQAGVMDEQLQPKIREMAKQYPQ